MDQDGTMKTDILGHNDLVSMNLMENMGRCSYLHLMKKFAKKYGGFIQGMGGFFS